MFSIGDFARLGRVSVRMLHHYDAIGLLPPATVDRFTGYRFYAADQLHRLNRIIALKDLGFTLHQVQTILDDRVDVAELRGMLRLRRMELAERLAADAQRLAGVEARLRMIEREGHMNTEDVVVKQVPALRVAELTATAGSYAPEDIGPAIQPLYPELFRLLEAAGVTPTGPAVAYYEPAGNGTEEAVLVHAAAGVTVGPQPDQGFAVVDLPAVETAATVIHRGAMDDADQSLHVLARWVEENGYRPVGYAREVYVHYDAEKPAEGITELQLAVTRD